MELAIDEARKSLEKKLLPVGAVLVVDNEVVGRAHKQQAYSYHLDHAEMLLLRNYFQNKNLKRNKHHVSLYTTLEPCMMCIGTILHCPIDTIVYSTSDPYGGGCSIVHAQQLPVRHKDHPLEAIGGILEKKTRKLFKEFIEMNTGEFYSRENIENPFIRHILG